MAISMNIKHIFVKVYQNLSDCIWPRSTGKRSTTPTYKNYVQTNHAKFLPHIESHIEQRLSQTEERRATVDHKISSLFIVMSIASSVIIAVVLGITNLNVSDKIDRCVSITVLILVVYIVLQLSLAAKATVTGQERRAYQQMKPSEIVPKSNESVEQYRIRLANQRIYIVNYNENTINEKVDQMAVAHRAMTNSIYATMLLVTVVATFIGWTILAA